MNNAVQTFVCMCEDEFLQEECCMCTCICNSEKLPNCHLSNLVHRFAFPPAACKRACLPNTGIIWFKNKTEQNLVIDGVFCCILICFAHCERGSASFYVLRSFPIFLSHWFDVLCFVAGCKHETFLSFSFWSSASNSSWLKGDRPTRPFLVPVAVNQMGWFTFFRGLRLQMCKSSSAGKRKEDPVGVCNREWGGGREESWEVTPWKKQGEEGSKAKSQAPGR